jgi:hypothetical protein
LQELVTTFILAAKCQVELPSFNSGKLSQGHKNEFFRLLGFHKNGANSINILQVEHAHSTTQVQEGKL